MLNDLDSSIQTLLERDLPASLVAQIDISFDAPDDQFPPPRIKLPAIDLFLYDVRENRELRSNEPLLRRQDNGSATLQAPPVRVDCSYLITAWARESSTTPVQDEHSLLGEVMRVLLRYPALPAEVLQGSLAGPDLPLPSSVLQPGRLQSLGEFWQALGGKPKTALNYQVTVALDPHAPIDAALVLEKVLQMRTIEPGEKP